MMRTYCFDRRGFGKSQGERGCLQTNERAFKDHWDFNDTVAHLCGYPSSIPKILVSHGLGSLYAAHLQAQRPGFFKSSISIAPWLGLKSKPSLLSQSLMRAKLYMPRTSRGYNSQDYQWRDQYLTDDFKNALEGKDLLYLYDRMSNQSMLNLLELFDILENPEDKVQENMKDPNLVILPETPSPFIGNEIAEAFFM